MPSRMTAIIRRNRDRNKKADLVEPPEVFDRVGLLTNELPSHAGLPLI
jgi:hypothetical protein